ncbi:MAG: RHS repeat protein [Deltaproteobacteria bacterium]|nr:RHS repeat protein [Deltaproteobacteria bacterium]
MITKYATFREFSLRNPGTNRYELNSPSDEKRSLYYVPATAGWELRDPDGTVQVFDASGKWTQTRDRHNNQYNGTYNKSGELTDVTMPDGRSDHFTYAGGRLATVGEIGVDGTSTHLWIYSWSGSSLGTILRPDGSYWEFHYDDVRFPGYLTRMDLVTSTGIHRVEGGWEYDASANVIKSWKGDGAFTGPNAIERLSYAWTNPEQPTKLVLTDAIGSAPTTYMIGRDTVSGKPRVRSVSGDCPVCGSGLNPTYTYGSSANPLFPTSIVDGRGIRTDMVYDANGLETIRTEAVGTPQIRTKTWEYSNPTFPGLLTAKQEASTSGSGVRRTEYLLNSNGDPTTVRETGTENSASFVYDTLMTYNDAGMVTTIDYPTPGTDDLVTFNYDDTMGRNGLILLNRVDPAVDSVDLTTTYQYDAFNRRTVEIDVNGVATETTYDPLNRILSVTQLGTSKESNLLTNYSYNGFGDLDFVILPKRNVIDYIYDAGNGDLAKGRVSAVERKLDETTPGERTAYLYDDFGRRIHEEFQGLVGSSWVAASWRDFQYYNRCQLKKTIDASGISATEYRYDCAGNVDRVWDLLHPSNGQTNAASTSYTYDSLNRRLTTTQPWAGTGGGFATTTNGYDVQDHLVSVLDANSGSTTFQYSDRDLMTRQISEVTGTTLYTYTPRGSLESETDSRGVVTNREYDALDRLRAISYPSDPTLDVSYTWGLDQKTFEAGRLTAIASVAGSTAYAYDRFGRLLQDGDLFYEYDANGNQVKITYPGATADYVYDFADRQSGLVLNQLANPVTLVSEVEYRPFGPLKSYKLGNGPTVTRATDSRYYLDRISTSDGLFDWDYTLDAVGNPTAIADMAAGQNRTYTYQDFNYFLRSGNGPWGTRSWTYDKIGNRLTEVHSGVTDSYTYSMVSGHRTPKLTQIAFGGGGGAKSYSYNPAGDVTGTVRGGIFTSYTIDAANHLRTWQATDLTPLDVEYDGRGFIYSTATPSYSDPSHTETRFEYSSTGTLLSSNSWIPSTSYPLASSSFLHFAGMPIALYRITDWTPDGMIYYFINDHLTTPVAIAGQPSSSSGLEPFGVDYAGTLPSRGIAFAGQVLGPDFPDGGLYYNLFRWYEPSTGRYSSADRLIPTSAREPNPFRYASANPIRFLDPMGLFSFDYESCCRAKGPNPESVASAACALSRRPSCRKLLSGQSWSGAKDRGGAALGNVMGCYSRFCDPFHKARVRCIETNQDCGGTPPNGGIELNVPGANTCGDKMGEPQNYTTTFFHEIAHNCGLPAKHPEWWQPIQQVCAGDSD